MSTKRVLTEFTNIHQYWNYIQEVSTTNLKIITTKMTLSCVCAEEDLAFSTQFEGNVIKRSAPTPNQYSSHQTFKQWYKLINNQVEAGEASQQ